MIHGRYRSPGGEDISARTEASGLRRLGWEVTELISDSADLGCGPRAALEMIWNRRGGRQVREAVLDLRACLVHVQNAFPAVSFSAHAAAQALGVPVVQHVRNARFVCPAGTQWRRGKPCRRCAGSALSAVAYGCWRGRAASAVAVAAQRGPQRVIGRIDAFIVTSRALLEDVRSRVPAEKTMIAPNRLLDDPGAGVGPRRGIVFAGRAVFEKGGHVLVQAARLVGPQHPVTIISDGPDLGRWRAEAPPWVRFTGWSSWPETLAAMRRARVVVVPSLWSEPFGRVAMEGMACGATVVASRIGGLPEVVGDAGLLVPPADPAALAQAIVAGSHKGGHVGRQRFIKRFLGPPMETSALYRRLLSRSRSNHSIDMMQKEGTTHA